MKNITKYKHIYAVLSILMLFSACKDDLIPVPPGPVVPKATDTLDAVYVTTPPTSVSSSYWSTANFHPVTCIDLSMGNLYPDGYLNMTGTYTGTSGFNEGNSPNLIMKAAYDSLNVYILLEWSDSTLNISNSSWYFNGPADPLNTAENSNGFTSQKNNDHAALAFEIQSATGPGGTFSSEGCAATCHSSQMGLSSGSVDIWNWNLALSEPMGYANDMVLTSSGLTYDSGLPTFIRNSAGSTSRSGPAFSWNGAVQNVTRGNGNSAIVDNAYFLLLKDTTSFANTASVTVGDSAYNNITYGCWQCHGPAGNGTGPTENAVPFINNPSLRSFYAWQAFATWAGNSTNAPTHDGASYWNQMSPAQQRGVFAYILSAFAGVPGYLLQEPTGSSADIISSSNVSLANVSSGTNIQQYKVLLIRKLNTGNSDDAVFTPSQKSSYTFGVALMDNDGINHIGSFKETLQFMKK